MSASFYLDDEVITYAYHMDEVITIEWESHKLTMTRTQAEEMMALLNTLKAGQSYNRGKYFRPAGDSTEAFDPHEVVVL